MSFESLNLNTSSENQIVFVLGPTASGKSALAREIALKKRGVILNCDSVQSYQFVDIGSAKPTFEERQELTHLLFDFVEPPAEITAGQFREMAREKIEKYIQWSPIVAAGGSGFYIRALQSKMFQIKDVSPESLQKIYDLEQAEGVEGLYKEMLQLDPMLRTKIMAADSYRIKRALGLMWTYKKTMTEIREETAEAQDPGDWPYKTLKIGLEISRDDLRVRVRQRTEEMLKKGWIEETQKLLSMGLEDWSPMKSVGYKELVAHLKGEMSLEETKELIVTSTMQLAKKQMTWFRKDPDIVWVDAKKSFAEIQTEVPGLA